MKEGGSLSVLIISPNLTYRTILQEFLHQPDGIVVVGGYPDIKAVIKEVSQPCPDLAIVDSTSINNVIAARKTWTKTLIICLLDYIGDLDAALSFGADCCVLKDGGSSAITRAVTALTGCRT